MTTKAASRKSMRPVRKSEAQGKATTRPAKAPRLTLDERIAQAKATNGSADDALTAIGKAQDALAAATENAKVWIGIAVAWQADGRSARRWVTEVGGNPNTLGRLVRAGALLTASKAGKGTRTLTVGEAVKVSNASTAAKVAGLVESMAAGGDPLDTKASRPGAVKSGAESKAGRSRSGRVTTASPATLVEMLDAMIKIAPKANHAQAVEAAKRATTLAGILTARAATLAKPVKGERAAMAG